MGSFVESYAGPGSYGLDKLSSPGGEWQLLVGDTTFSETDTSTGSLVVNADGSGSFTFAGLANENNPQGASQLSGSVSWVCADR